MGDRGSRAIVDRRSWCWCLLETADQAFDFAYFGIGQVDALIKYEDDKLLAELSELLHYSPRAIAPLVSRSATRARQEPLTR